MTESPSPLSADDDHEVIHLGGEAAVIVPLDEYRWLRKVHEWHQGAGTVRTNAEEFLALSGLAEDDKERLREKYGI